MKIHYVYRLEDPVTREFYIGCRTCECDPDKDTYKGSMYKWRPKDKSRLIKTIIKKDFKTRKEAALFENKTILEFINNGLNRNYQIPGGNLGFFGRNHSLETKEVISKKKKNSPRTEREIAAAKKRIGVPVYKSKEWILNNAESIKKPIKQYTLSGEFVGKWKSAKDAEDKCGFDRKGIGQNLNYKTKSAYGFIWRFADDKNVTPRKPGKGFLKVRPVKNLNTGIIYKSRRQASKELGISSDTIHKMILENNKSKFNLIYYGE